MNKLKYIPYSYGLKILLFMLLLCTLLKPDLALGVNVLIADVNLKVPNDNGLINAAKAAEYINQSVIMPGEEFSFNTLVGKRSADRGFILGRVIVSSQDGGYKYVMEYGGGVCRVSTALHQAVMQADLRILERHGHTIPVQYARPGEDASVQIGSWDYRFINNRNSPILIEMKQGESSIIAKIYEQIGKTKVQVFLNNKQKNYSIIPVLKNGDVWVPLRETAETVGLKLTWDSLSQKAKISGKGVEVELKPGSRIVKVNNRESMLESEILIEDGTLKVPLIFLADLYGFEAKVVCDT